MTSSDKIKLLESLLTDAEALQYNDGNIDKVMKRSDMIIKKVFGPKSDYINSLREVDFDPGVVIGGMSSSIYVSSFNSGKTELVNLINVMLEDVSLSVSLESTPNKTVKGVSNKIFIVHGHNEEMKQATARFIEKIDYQPIILHEQPNKGRTIIEKFTDYSNVNFAIILVSGDDVAFKKSESVDNAMLRARQNVILELGFFLGKIGRENVVVLYEQEEKLEIPSDYQGVLYVPYDNSGNWKFSILKEMKAAGFEVDGNKLLD